METSDVDFNNKYVLYLIENPDQIIMDETKEHIVLAARSENEEKSEDSENDDNAYATYRAFYRGKFTTVRPLYRYCCFGKNMSVHQIIVK
ncbi:unnamed protein product [Rhizophagus irregularis]|nr:unnamed protein product [Rhizophagus irregularis]